MTNTTQEERDHVLNNTFHPDSPVVRCARDADKLARVESRCLLRSEIDAPDLADEFHKWMGEDGKHRCWWLRNGKWIANATDVLPSLTVDHEGVSLPIIEDRD